jgi:hypothetical protein
MRRSMLEPRRWQQSLLFEPPIAPGFAYYLPMASTSGSATWSLNNCTRSIGKTEI